MTGGWQALGDRGQEQIDDDEKMKLALFLVVVAVLGTSKVIRVLLDDETLWVAFGWSLAGIWFFWIAWAYLKNLDLPAAGAFRYEGGSNQTARRAYFLVMTGIFVFLMISS